MSTTITLTGEQARTAAGHPRGVRATDPDTRREYVLVPADVFDKLLEAQYDDGPWTAEERDALAAEAGQHAGWDEMSAYDNYPEKP